MKKGALKKGATEGTPLHRAHRFPWRREGGVVFQPPETVSAVAAENEKEAKLRFIFMYHPGQMCVECDCYVETVWRHPVA